MDHAKFLDVLTSLPVNQSKLPRAVCFATSCPASHAMCSFIESSGYASGPIRRCLIIGYIIMIIDDQYKIVEKNTPKIRKNTFIHVSTEVIWKFRPVSPSHEQ